MTVGGNMEKVIVDKDICIGCGFCAGTNPEVFDMGDDTAYTKEDKNIINEMSETEQEEVKDILEGCPVNAIKIENVEE